MRAPIASNSAVRKPRVVPAVAEKWLTPRLPPDGGQGDSGFTLYSMAVEAAVEGLGVAIGHDPLVARELESGRLVAPFDLRVPAPRRYAAITPQWSRNRPDVRDFIDWLRAEAA